MIEMTPKEVADRVMQERRSGQQKESDAIKRKMDKRREIEELKESMRLNSDC